MEFDPVRSVTVGLHGLAQAAIRFIRREWLHAILGRMTAHGSLVDPCRFKVIRLRAPVA